MLRLALLLVLVVYAMGWTNAPYMQPDSYEYFRVASDLRDFHIDELHDRTPGYPALLLVTGSTERSARLLLYAQLLMYGIGVYALGSVIRSEVSERASVFFTALVLLPRYVAPAGYAMTEAFTQFLLVVSLFSAFKWLVERTRGWLILTGVATALCGVTRPTYAGLSLALIASLAVLRFGLRWCRLDSRELLLSAAILIGGSSLTVGGLAAMNLMRFGYFGLTPLLGVNLSTRTVTFLERLPEADAIARELLIRSRDQALVQRGSSHTALMYSGSAVASFQKAFGMTKAEASRYLVHLNIELIRAAPLNYLQAIVTAFGSFWMPGANQLANGHSRILQGAWVVLDVLVFALFGSGILVVGGALLNRIVGQLVIRDKLHSDVPSDHVLYVLTGTVIAYTAIVSSMVGHGDIRFREPVDTLILVTTFVGISAWWRSLQRASVAPASIDIRPVLVEAPLKIDKMLRY